MSTSWNVLVTGAAGQLGRAVVAAAARRSIRVVGLERSELDVSDAAAVHDVITRARPRAVIHCAAWTDVDGAEADPPGAYRVNEDGCRSVARACADTGAHLVSVSTDYVFGDSGPAGHAEEDVPAPSNVYGSSKLAGEQAIRTELGSTACIVRTAWLFSSHPPNFVRTIAAAALERDQLDVVADQRGNPTWCAHLADALLTCALEQIQGTLHLVDGPPATWHELATAVVDELGAQCTVRPVTSDAFPRPARRSAVSILRSTRPDAPAMGSWRDGIRESLQGIDPS